MNARVGLGRVIAAELRFRSHPRSHFANPVPRLPRDNRIHWGIALFWLTYFSTVIGGAFWLGWWLS